MTVTLVTATLVRTFWVVFLSVFKIFGEKFGGIEEKQYLCSEKRLEGFRHQEVSGFFFFIAPKDNNRKKLLTIITNCKIVKS